MTVSGASTRKHETVGEKIDDASSGNAGNAAEKDLVTKLAGDVNGVRNVQNRMTVAKSK